MAIWTPRALSRCMALLCVLCSQRNVDFNHVLNRLALMEVIQTYSNDTNPNSSGSWRHSFKLDTISKTSCSEHSLR